MFFADPAAKALSRQVDAPFKAVLPNYSSLFLFTDLKLPLFEQILTKQIYWQSLIKLLKETFGRKKAEVKT